MPGTSELDPTQKAFIHNLHQVTAFREEPSRYKLHERFPDLPDAPDKIQMRLGYIPQELFPSFCESYAHLIAHSLYLKGLFSTLEIDHIIGVPDAGNPLAEALAANLSKKRITPITTLTLIKKQLPNGKRRIGNEIIGNYKPGQKVIIGDDVISTAESVFETIRAVEANDLEVVQVFAAINRELTGIERLLAAGYDVTTSFTATQLYKYSAKKRFITQEAKDKGLAFMLKAQEALRTSS